VSQTDTEFQRLLAQSSGSAFHRSWYCRHARLRLRVAFKLSKVHCWPWSSSGPLFSVRAAVRDSCLFLLGRHLLSLQQSVRVRDGRQLYSPKTHNDSKIRTQGAVLRVLLS